MLSVESLTPLGHALGRPECVRCTARGDVAPGNRPPRPNGIALRADASFLVADLSLPPVHWTY